MKTFLNYKYIIVGKSGSGKDYLMDKMVEKGFKPCIKTTTRPMRDGETQDKTYHFISKNEFEESLNDFLVYETFIVEPKDKPKETWYYGITKEEFENSDVVILTPNELSKIDLEKCCILYLDINDNIRRKRLNDRSDNNDSVDRRIKSDNEDFFLFWEYNITILDPEFKIDDVIIKFKEGIIEKEIDKYFTTDLFKTKYINKLTNEVIHNDYSITKIDFELKLLKPYMR